MFKTALACVILALGSGCVGNANDPENQDPSEESVTDEAAEVDEAATDSPLYVGVQATDSPLYGAATDSPLYSAATDSPLY